MAGSTTVLETPQQAQDKQFMEEVTASIARVGDRFSDLDKKVQDQFKQHAADIGRLKDELAGANARADRDYEATAARIRTAGVQSFGFDSPQQAADFGRCMLIAISGDRRHLAGLSPAYKAALDGSTGAKGGFLIPEQFIGPLVRNLEDYGVIDSEATRAVLTSGIASIARRASGYTCYYPDLGVAPTASDLAVARITLNSTNYSALAYVDNWMLESDQYTDIGALIMQELAYCIAYSTDLNCFRGDGSSTYARLTGLFNRTDLLKVDCDSGDDTFAEVIAANVKYLGAMLGKVPQWADDGNLKFYGHREIFWRYLATKDSQGMPVANIMANSGKPVLTLMGYPFRVTQVGRAMADTAVSTVMLLLANLKRGTTLARFKDRHSIRSSDQYKFAEGQTTVLASCLQDFVVQDVSAVVQLKTAAS